MITTTSQPGVNLVVVYFSQDFNTDRRHAVVVFMIVMVIRMITFWIATTVAMMIVLVIMALLVIMGVFMRSRD